MIASDELLAGMVLSVDKPRQWTSFQAVNKVKSTIRRLYGLKKFKIGHAGTLDPLATGLLLVCVGKATKQIPSLQDGEKEYTGTLVLGATTASYDLERPIDRLYPSDHITPEMIESARQSLTGEQEQVPPMFSAVKIDGQRAYDIARQDDEEVEIKPKRITIKEFVLTNWRLSEADQAETLPTTATHHLYDNPQGIVPAGLPMADFRIVCSKGTYIRSLVRDFGLALNSGATLTALRRERIGEYTLKNATSLDNIEQYLQEL